MLSKWSIKDIPEMKNVSNILLVFNENVKSMYKKEIMNYEGNVYYHSILKPELTKFFKINR